MLCSFANSLPPLFSEMSHIKFSFGVGHPLGRTTIDQRSSKVKFYYLCDTLWIKIQLSSHGMGMKINCTKREVEKNV